ncbi:hypothetical protein ACFL1C_06920 [Pseudomonadota bacterium]
MNASQRKAVSRHRRRQKEKGMVRMEVSVPDSDRELIRQAAANLRAGGKIAEQTRAAMNSIINPFAGMNLKELIEAMPLGELEIERSKETGREIEF